MSPPADQEIRAVLERVRSFAVVGASAKPDRPSFGVMAYLKAHGFTVVPVNPGLAGQEILGARVYARLADVPGSIDVVDVFRSPDAALDVVRAAITEKERLGIAVVWMQIGVINDEAAREARAAGLTVIMDRCPKQEHSRLFR